mmetsp:Transcript_7435/g.11819  ORF Transcript_7435/g.11819 Transcript_7435/m.11819 type:complete len:215 (+) Transcript_7435:775-1419(+)
MRPLLLRYIAHETIPCQLMNFPIILSRETLLKILLKLFLPRCLELLLYESEVLIQLVLQYLAKHQQVIVHFRVLCHGLEHCSRIVLYDAFEAISLVEESMQVLRHCLPRQARPSTYAVELCLGRVDGLDEVLGLHEVEVHGASVGGGGGGGSGDWRGKGGSIGGTAPWTGATSGGGEGCSGETRGGGCVDGGEGEAGTTGNGGGISFRLRASRI